MDRKQRTFVVLTALFVAALITGDFVGGKFFVLFCRALDLSEADALTYWNFIKNARRLNQNLGRALAAQYAEILFQPESAVAYRKIPLDVVKQLQQDALDCVFRVEGVTPPAAGRDS